MRTRPLAGAGIVLAAAALTCTLSACAGTPHSDAARTTAPAGPTTVPAAASGPHSTLSVDPATSACWWAIHDQYTPGTAQLMGTPSMPPVCASLNPDDIGDVKRDVLAYLNSVSQ